MTEFGRFILQRRKALNLSVPELAKEIELNPATVHKLVSGVRPMSRERAAKICARLCPEPDLRAQFELLYEKSLEVRQRTSPLDLAVDSEASRLRVATIDYPPFAGAPDRFVDLFTHKALSMAMIHLETVDQPLRTAHGAPVFDINQRIEAVDRRDVQLVYNLASLDRSKRLSFINLPINVSVSGVLFSPLEEPAASRTQRLRAARRLFVEGFQPKDSPFRVVAVRGEVGHIFLEQTHGLQENKHPDRREALGIRCIDLQETLEPAFLAKRLRDLGKLGPVFLCCDEFTVLQVLLHLNGSGLLLLPPSSDQASIHAVGRRVPPAYFFAIGLRRQNNWPMIDYLQQMFATYVCVEGESISALYRLLYVDLVREVSACLARTGIYVGGVRRTPYLVGSPPLDEADQEEWALTLQTLVDQHARAVARRCLTLSRRAIENLPPAMAAWRGILERTRKMIQVAEAGDRTRVRHIILYCARIALGREVVAWTNEGGVVETSFELLRTLLPARSETKVAPLNFVEDRRTNEVWETFLYLLGLELDLDLSDLKSCEERHFESSADLGRLISRIQAKLEASRDSQLSLTIRPFNSRLDLSAFKALREEYLQKSTPELGPLLTRAFTQASDCSLSLVAYNLGRAVGFIQAEVVSAQELSTETLSGMTATERKAIHKIETIEIKLLHVTGDMAGAGVSRRLIRRIIEEGNERFVGAIWTALSNWSPKEQEKFRRAGFTVSAKGDRLWYKFLLDQKQQPSLAPASRTSARKAKPKKGSPSERR